MKDTHIHIEHQPYTLKTIEKMVAAAQARNIDELYLLDHTHKFAEFSFLYESCQRHPQTWAWYSKKNPIPIRTYLDFIRLVKAEKWPVKINFGLEVCYFEQSEDRLREELKKFDFDFLIGSVHFVDGAAIDIDPIIWKQFDVNTMWKRYFEIMEKLIRSGLFDSLAHPDTIKLFGVYPNYDLIPTYKKIAAELKKAGMKTEINTGLSRYDFPYLGLTEKMLQVFKEEGVELVWASDAHVAENIGNGFLI